MTTEEVRPASPEQIPTIWWSCSVWWSDSHLKRTLYFIVNSVQTFTDDMYAKYKLVFVDAFMA